MEGGTRNRSVRVDPLCAECVRACPSCKHTPRTYVLRSQLTVVTQKAHRDAPISGGSSTLLFQSVVRTCRARLASRSVVFARDPLSQRCTRRWRIICTVLSGLCSFYELLFVFSRSRIGNGIFDSSRSAVHFSGVLGVRHGEILNDISEISPV